MGMPTRKKKGLAAAMGDDTMQYAIARSEAAAAATTKWLDDHKIFVAALATALTLPVPAFAASNATSTFNDVKSLISTGLQVVGGGMVVFGAVTVGMNVSGAAQGNGGAIGAGIATMVGGAVIAVAGTYFSTIGDIS